MYLGLTIRILRARGFIQSTLARAARARRRFEWPATAVVVGSPCWWRPGAASSGCWLGLTRDHAPQVRVGRLLLCCAGALPRHARLPDAIGVRPRPRHVRSRRFSRPGSRASRNQARTARNEAHRRTPRDVSVACSSWLLQGIAWSPSLLHTRLAVPAPCLAGVSLRSDEGGRGARADSTSPFRRARRNRAASCSHSFMDYAR